MFRFTLSISLLVICFQVPVFGGQMQIVNFNASPGKYIGKFNGCTGSLIGPSHFATAGHCDRKRSGGKFYLHYDDGNYTASAEVSSISSGYIYDKNKNDFSNDRANIDAGDDWTINKIDKNFEKTGYLGANAQAPAAVTMTGYGDAYKKGESPSHDPGCGLSYKNTRVLSHNCSVSPGHSGSPLVDGNSRIIGIISTATEAMAFNGPVWTSYQKQVFGKDVAAPAAAQQVQQIQQPQQPQYQAPQVQYQQQVYIVVPVQYYQVQPVYAYPVYGYSYGYYRR